MWRKNKQKKNNINIHHTKKKYKRSLKKFKRIKTEEENNGRKITLTFITRKK